MKNILVFFGGTTVEHDVSIITGVMMLNSLDRTYFNPIPIYVDNDGRWFTGDILFEVENYKKLNYKKLKQVLLKGGDNKLYYVKGSKLNKNLPIYSALNCMHGERGEDGSLAGLLAMSNIPLASPSLTPSGIAIDKDLTKKVLKGIGIKTVKGIAVKRINEVEKIKDTLTYPVMIKPCYLGSSIGIEMAKNAKELVEKARIVFRYDKKIIIEKKLKNFYEINCAIYRAENNELVVSECEKPISHGNILSFDDKYKSGEKEFPAKIDSTIKEKIQDITKKIYNELDFFGVIRIDYFVVNNEVIVNEINSVPGSLAYYLFTPSLKEFSKVLTAFIFSAVRNFSSEGTLKRQLSTSILNVKGFKSTKHL